MPRVLSSLVAAALCGSLQTEISTLSGLVATYDVQQPCALHDIPCIHREAYVDALLEASYAAEYYSRVLECGVSPSPPDVPAPP